MRLLGRLGLRWRLALALAAIASLSVGLATLFSNQGLHPRISAAAEARLERSAEHMAMVAATVYRRERGWSPQGAQLLRELARLNGLSLRVRRPDGRFVSKTGPTIPPDANASAPIVVDGVRVGEVVVAPAEGELLAPEEERLKVSLDRLHLLAGLVSVAAGLLLALLLAETLSRPLRRLQNAAVRIKGGDLDARVAPRGGPEFRELGQALNELARALGHQEELRREGVANVAHELRTPVNALLARIEAAQDGLLAGEDNLEAMHAEALRLGRLLDDLALLSDAERPGLLLEKCVVDLAEVVRAEVALCEPAFAEKGVGLSSELRPTRVVADADRLGQIAMNLLSNALRYTEPGGGVRVRVEPNGGDAVFEVADTGIGIGAEDLLHVFERFWRAEKSRSRETGGTGVGLAIASELARAHDGRIEVRSELGQGSTFRVVLPAGDREPFTERAETVHEKFTALGQS